MRRIPVEQNMPVNPLQGQQNLSETTGYCGDQMRPELPGFCSQAVSPDSVPEPSNERNRKKCSRESRPKKRAQKALIQLQPISNSLCFGGRSTLQGTPWEDALYSSNKKSKQPSEKCSKNTGKRDKRSVKEIKIAAFWKQFFGWCTTSWRFLAYASFWNWFANIRLG